MRPVQLLQSGRVVIIGNDALHVSFHSNLSQQVTHSSHSLHTVTTYHALHILQYFLQCL
jgi:hypothetical protein